MCGTYVTAVAKNNYILMIGLALGAAAFFFAPVLLLFLDYGDAVLRPLCYAHIHINTHKPAGPEGRAHCEHAISGVQL